MSHEDYENEEDEEYASPKTTYEEIWEHVHDLRKLCTEGWSEEQLTNLQLCWDALKSPSPPYTQVIVERARANQKLVPCFSLTARDHEPGVISLGKLFVEADDLSNTVFALAAFDDITVADMILGAEWAKIHHERWILEAWAIHEWAVGQDLVSQSRMGKTSATTKLLDFIGKRFESTLTRMGRSKANSLGSAGVGRPKTAQNLDNDYNDDDTEKWLMGIVEGEGKKGQPN